MPSQKLGTPNARPLKPEYEPVEGPMLPHGREHAGRIAPTTKLAMAATPSSSVAGVRWAIQLGYWRPRKERHAEVGPCTTLFSQMTY